MAQGLSLLIQVENGGPQTGSIIAKAFQTQTASPDILHYVWAVEMPPPAGAAPSKTTTVLLTTVYDEQFEPYIRDLVLANPALFNAAAKIIVGLQNLIPVESPTNLPKFIDFVRQHDLTKGGTLPGFTQAYKYTVVQIKNALGG
jgi:hypothetical protein